MTHFVPRAAPEISDPNVEAPHGGRDTGVDVGAWAHRAATVMQHLVMHLHRPVREEFETAFRRCARELPEPRTRLEALWLHEKSASLRLTAVARLDEQHHAGGAVCLPQLMRAATDWNGRSTVRFEIRRWLRSFVRVFDDGHGLRVPVGAAKVLLRQPHRQVRLEQVAESLGCELRALGRAFSNRYHLTPKAFHQRVRARHAAIALRSGEDKVASVAWQCGYASAKNLYVALDRAIGLTPTEVRALSAERFAGVLAGPLETNPARLVRSTRLSVRAVRSEVRIGAALQR